MFRIETVEVHKNKIESVMHPHYAEEIEQLRALGFNQDHYVCDIRGVFSTIYAADVLYRSRKDIWEIKGLARLVIYYLYILHEDGYAYATVLKNRTQFATMFEDGAIIQTISPGFLFMHDNSLPEKNYILQKSKTRQIDQIWTLHQNAVKQRADLGYFTAPVINVADALEIGHRIDVIQTMLDPQHYQKNKR